MPARKRDRPIGATHKNSMPVDSPLPWKEPDSKCNGRRTDGEGYCRLVAGHGTDHVGIGRCKRHGGSTKLYAQQVEKLRAAASVEQYGLPVEIDPHTALIQELERTVGHVEWLRLRVGELETSGMHGPVGGGQGAIPEEKPNVWIGMYREERAHLVKVAKACIDAGIEERRVQLAEAQGMLIAAILKAVIGDLGLTDDPRVPAIVRRHLTQLPGASGTPEALPAGEGAALPSTVGDDAVPITTGG